MDDHSRYSLVLAACANEQAATVRGHLIAAFRRYGLPQRMLMDNGSPWGPCGVGPEEAWTGLSVWLMRLGIRVLHGRPFHPQTQGKEERFHQTLVAELLRWQVFVDVPDAQKYLDPWRQVYNHERPHEALNLQVPAQRYQPSARSYPETLPEIVYAPGDLVRRVRLNGALKFHDTDYRIGKAFRGELVALRPTRIDGLWDVYYCQQRVGQIDQHAPGTRSLRGCRPLAALAAGSPEG